MFKVKTYEDFVIRFAHIMGCNNLTDADKYYCSKLAYAELAQIEIGLEYQDIYKKLLKKVYAKSAPLKPK